MFIEEVCEKLHDLEPGTLEENIWLKIKGGGTTVMSLQGSPADVLTRLQIWTMLFILPDIKRGQTKWQWQISTTLILLAGQLCQEYKIEQFLPCLADFIF